MILSLIAAVGENYELGKNNDLIWHLDGDLPFFRRVTTGKTVIMGRKTFESLPKALPKRRNIVLTTDSQYVAEGAEVFTDFKEILENVKNEDEVFVIGGGSVYTLFMPYADRIYLTEAQARDSEADTYFPRFDKELFERKSIDFGGTDIKYEHVLYEKK